MFFCFNADEPFLPRYDEKISKEYLFQNEGSRSNYHKYKRM